MADKEFANGIIVKTVDTKYGQIIKLSINKDSILNNPYNERGWVNIDLKTAKSGKMYAEINNYNPNGNSNSSVSQSDNTQTTSSDNLVEFGEMEAPATESLIDEEEIPF